MSKLTRVLLITIACVLLVIVFFFTMRSTPTTSTKEEAAVTPSETTSTRDKEKEAIRNKPFPLAGTGSEEGNGTDGVTPINKEPISE